MTKQREYKVRRTCWQFVLLILFLQLAIAPALPMTYANKITASTSDQHPPIGWSSWNSFSNLVDAKIIMAQAKAMATNGMKDAGYQYVNIDEGWWLGKRDSAGNIVVDLHQWPALALGEQAGDMANIVKFIHGLGLKAGIYTDAGESGCSYYGPDLGPRMPHTGSEGHYEQDFLQFAKWGFDYVKVDWCGGSNENLDPAVQYARIAHAIQDAEVRTGHSLYFSICNWGANSPWTWAPGIGGVEADIWRTTGDIVAPIVANTRNAGRRASFKGVLGNFDGNIHPEAQHTGFFNDPDMMMVGMPGLSNAQSQSHLTLWAVSGAPLIIGADLTKLNPDVLRMLTNPEVIGVDQDPLGVQCTRVSELSPGLEVWSKRLTTGPDGYARRAIVLLNRTGNAERIAVTWPELGLQTAPTSVRNLWKRENVGIFQTGYSAMVPAGTAEMFLVEGSEAPPLGHLHATVVHGQRGNLAWSFFGIKPITPFTWIRVHYSNISGAACGIDLDVNDMRQSGIVLPPTANGQDDSVTIALKLAVRTRSSGISFRGHGCSSLTIGTLEVLAGK